jgi:hypothetical protein
MKQIVIMPGGFHPFHAGHYALYNSALEAFPNADVYVAATNDQSERPFPFNLKEKLAKLAGVKPGRFVQVKSPFQAKEITQHYNPNEDVLIFVRSEKDKNEQPKPGGTKKDGSPAYFQPYTGKDLQPFSKHAYMAYLPTVTFGPGIKSATEIRKAWPTLNDKRKTALVMSLYPAAQKNPKLAQTVVGMFDQVMGAQVDEDLSRRGFLKGMGAAAVGSTLSSYSNPALANNWKGEFLVPGIIEKNVKYFITDVKKEGNIFLVKTKRVGPSGESTTVRAIDCTKELWKYLEDDGVKVKNAQWSGLTKGSSAYHIFKTVCSSIYDKNISPKEAKRNEVRRKYANNPELLKSLEKVWKDEDAGKYKEQGVAEDKETSPVANAVIDFYKPVIADVQKEKVPDYVDQARELLSKTDDPTIRRKVLDILKKGKENPYLQGGIITTVGALLAGGILNSAQTMGLTPQQTNIALQGILNTVIPTLVSRINGRNWIDTIKYTLASAGVGTGIAAIAENKDYLEEK